MTKKDPITGETFAAADNAITIPMEEYQRLAKVDTLMEVLMAADNFNNSPVIAAVRKTWEELKAKEGAVLI